MGTWETFVQDIEGCPCGQGKIQRVIESPDNPWSSVHTSYRLACNHCSENWEMGYQGTLTELASEKEYKLALAASAVAADDLQSYLNSLLSLVTLPIFKRKVDEFEYLRNQGLYNETLGKYKYARRTREMREIAEISAESIILQDLVGKFGNLTLLQSKIKAANLASETAYAKANAVKRKHYR